VVFGNELLDAMPVTCFRVTEKGVVERYVCWNNARFATCERPASDAVHTRAKRLALALDFSSEIGLHAEAWVRSVAERLEEGVLLLVDYGFPRAEFYHPQRAQGTLMCHYRQRAHGDPLILVGLQDITAHVDFSGIAEAGSETGLELLGYTSQAAFLIGCGLAEMETVAADARAQLIRAQAINKLTGPHEMGELFKVIALGRGGRGPLRGFEVQDRRNRL
jgi:SAM-dependent MidA family methyltransferase